MGPSWAIDFRRGFAGRRRLPRGDHLRRVDLPGSGSGDSNAAFVGVAGIARPRRRSGGSAIARPAGRARAHLGCCALSLRLHGVPHRSLRTRPAGAAEHPAARPGLRPDRGHPPHASTRLARRRAGRGAGAGRDPRQRRRPPRPRGRRRRSGGRPKRRQLRPARHQGVWPRQRGRLASSRRPRTAVYSNDPYALWVGTGIRPIFWARARPGSGGRGRRATSRPSSGGSRSWPATYLVVSFRGHASWDRSRRDQSVARRETGCGRGRRRRVPTQRTSEPDCSGDPPTCTSSRCGGAARGTATSSVRTILDMAYDARPEADPG